MDDVFDDRRFKSYSHFSLTPGPVDPGHIDFRRFDPEALTILFGKESISLKACLAEVRALDRAVVAAHDSMSDGRVIPWVVE